MLVRVQVPPSAPYLKKLLRFREELVRPSPGALSPAFGTIFKKLLRFREELVRPLPGALSSAFGTPWRKDYFAPSQIFCGPRV